MSVEEALAYHCAPTLLGLKAASMVSFSVKTEEDERSFKTYLNGYRECFRHKGILFTVLSRQKEHILMLFYRPEIMEKLIASKLAKEILCRYGYPDSVKHEELLTFLKQRIAKCQGFPHEIGLFLGYPPEDVAAFIRCRGKNYLCGGYWKVYHNEAYARKIFACYKSCTQRACEVINAGGSIKAVLNMAG